jgi:hypothetical protein
MRGELTGAELDLVEAPVYGQGLGHGPE